MNPGAKFYFPISFKVIRHLTWTSLLCSLLVDVSPLSTPAFPPSLSCLTALSPTSSNLKCIISLTLEKSASFCCICPEIPKLCLNSVTHLLHSHTQLAELHGCPAAPASILLPLHVRLPDRAEGSVLFTTPSSLPGRRPYRILQSQGLFSTHAPCFQPVNIFKTSQRMWVFLVFPLSTFFSDICIKICEVTSAHTFLSLVL